MSKIVYLSKEFLIEVLNTKCFANLAEDTKIELLSDEEKDKRVVQLKSKIADLESKLAKKDEEITQRLRLQDDEFLEEVKQLKQQISDLEVKLAESEEAQEKAYQEGFLQKQFDKEMEISQLKRELVESKKTILKLKEANDSFSFMDYCLCKHLGKNNICLKDVKDFVKSFVQLKQQLAKKEETINNLEQQCLICNKDQENEQLKQQLAEKESDCEDAEQCAIDFQNRNTELEFEIEDLNSQISQLYDVNNEIAQDKISFAVEQLEKVKEKALHFYVNDTQKLTGFYVDVEKIDNQIKQLKGGGK